ncbi:MAG: DUF6491 family protein [bacterium]
MKQLVVILVSGFLVACAGSSEAPDGSRGGQVEADDGRGGESCIEETRIRGFRVLDEVNLVISGTIRRHYHVVLQRRAWGLKSSTPITFDSPSKSVCAGLAKLVYVGNSQRLERIRIRQITELNNEEYESLLVMWGLMKPKIETKPEPEEVEGAEVEEIDPVIESPANQEFDGLGTDLVPLLPNDRKPLND